MANVFTKPSILFVTLLAAGLPTCYASSADLQSLNYRVQYHPAAAAPHHPKSSCKGFQELKQPCAPKGVQHSHRRPPMQDRLSHKHTKRCAQKHTATACNPNTKHTHAVVRTTNTQTHSYKMIYTPENLSRFHCIAADGDTAVIINGGKPRSVSITSSRIHPTKLIDVYIRDGTLYLSRHHKRTWKHKAQQTVFVNVNVPYIQSIKLKGNARVMGYNIKSHGLAIHSNSSGNSKLQGKINLKDIVNTGTGCISVQWVNSDMLRVEAANHGKIQLAGTVNSVNIRATDCAHVDAKYLRAHNALTQTAGKATVDVTAIDALSGFASDFSNIKYYKTPKHLTRHTYASGNVLQMRYWN